MGEAEAVLREVDVLSRGGEGVNAGAAVVVRRSGNEIRTHILAHEGRCVVRSLVAASERVRGQIRHRLGILRAIGSDADRHIGRRRDGEAVIRTGTAQRTGRATDDGDVGQRKARHRMAEGGGNDKRIAHGGRSGGGEFDADRQRRCGGRVVDLLKVGHKVAQIRRVQRHALMRGDGFCECGSGAVVQIRSGGPDATQRRHIEAGERTVEALAAGGLLDRADIAEDVQGAVRESIATVTGGAILLTEDALTRSRRRGGAAVAVAVRRVFFGGE